jgi:hypothetical protein
MSPYWFSSRMLRQIAHLLLPKAAHYSWRFVSLAPVRFRPSYVYPTTTRFWRCTDFQIYDVFWRHRNLNNILQIAIWLSEHPGWDSRTPPWTTVFIQFVNNTLPRALCKFWFQLAANFMPGYSSKIFFKVRWKFDYE